MAEFGVRTRLLGGGDGRVPMDRGPEWGADVEAALRRRGVRIQDVRGHRSSPSGGGSLRSDASSGGEATSASNRKAAGYLCLEGGQNAWVKKKREECMARLSRAMSAHEGHGLGPWAGVWPRKRRAFGDNEGRGAGPSLMTPCGGVPSLLRLARRAAHPPPPPRRACVNS